MYAELSKQNILREGITWKSIIIPTIRSSRFTNILFFRFCFYFSEVSRCSITTGNPIAFGEYRGLTWSKIERTTAMARKIEGKKGRGMDTEETARRTRDARITSYWYYTTLLYSCIKSIVNLRGRLLELGQRYYEAGKIQRLDSYSFRGLLIHINT